jgi:hypothetical protein
LPYILQKETTWQSSIFFKDLLPHIIPE